MKIYEFKNFYAEYALTRKQKKEFRKKRNTRKMYSGLKMANALLRKDI